MAHRLDSLHCLLTPSVVLQSYGDSPAWLLTFFTDTLCCVVQSLRDSPIWQFTLFTDTLCCVVQSLRDWPVWQFTLFTDTLSCYRAKETHQIDSLHCSLTPSVVTELRRLTRSTVYIVHWHPLLCCRAKETQQLDSLHCSLTPLLCYRVKETSIIHWHLLCCVTERRRLVSHSLTPSLAVLQSWADSAVIVHRTLIPSLFCVTLTELSLSLIHIWRCRRR